MWSMLKIVQKLAPWAPLTGLYSPVAPLIWFLRWRCWNTEQLWKIFPLFHWFTLCTKSHLLQHNHSILSWKATIMYIDLCVCCFALPVFVRSSTKAITTLLWCHSLLKPQFWVVNGKRFISSSNIWKNKSC